MKKKLDITGAYILDEELILTSEEPIEGLSAKGQMLVDSDNFAFIYLMESGDEYTYVVLPEAVWPELKKSLDRSLPVFLKSGTDKIELYEFHDELGYLAENIKGNGNYGETMVNKIESLF